MAQTAQPSVLLGFLLVFSASSMVPGQAVWAKTGAVQLVPPEKGSESSSKPSKKKVQTGIAGSFLSGRFARQNQDITMAAKYINESLAHDPENRVLREDALRLNLLAGNIPKATELAKQLAAEKENDPLIASLLMLDFVKAGDYGAAKEVVSQAPAIGLFGLIRPVILQWLAIGAGDVKSPISMQAAIDKSGFFAPFLTYHSALMNDLLGRTKDAESAYLKADADAAATPYRVVQALANFYARNGKWAEAQHIYDRYASANPNSSLIPEKLVPGTTPKPLVANARAGLAEVFFTTASLLFADDTAQDTFLYLRIALELRPNLPPGQLMLANLYEQVEDYPQAIRIYDSMERGTVFSRRAQVRKALNYEALGDRDTALELLDTLSKRYPDDATALITKGDLLRDKGDYAEAISAYSGAIDRSAPLSATDWPLLYARGVSYERNGDWDHAEGDFLQALALAPNQPDVLNYLGYSWLVMRKNMTKARDYLDIAAAARPDDPHIIDSVGWAYYLSGDFAYAATMFEKAIQLMPDDATLNEHLGDAYFRIGRVTEARYQWERALGASNGDTAEVLRTKLSKGLPPFVKPASQAQNPTSIESSADEHRFPKTRLQ